MNKPGQQLDSAVLKNLLIENFSPEDLERKGWVNYSGLDVLATQKGGVYLMGINPGVDDSNVVLRDFEPPQDENWSAYIHQCWARHNGGKCEHLVDGKVLKPKPHQRDVVDLSQIIAGGVQNVFSANAVFVATNQADQLRDLRRLWDCCWPIHQNFIGEMMPRMIVCIGNGSISSYKLLAQRATIDEGDCGRGRDPYRNFFSWKRMKVRFPLHGGSAHACTVVGLPHPSKSSIFGTLAVNFTRYKTLNPVDFNLYDNVKEIGQS